MTALETKIKEAIEPIITKLNYKIYDVIYEKEGKDNYLRIFIDTDKKEGISLNDCETDNNGITDFLDEKNFIKSQYFLEISSPGIERRIRDDEQLEQNLNSKVEVHLYKAIEKEKTIIGILEKFDDNTVTIKKSDEKEIIIEKNNITNMKTVFNWEEN